MHQLNRIIRQLATIRDSLPSGENTQSRATLALFKGERIPLRKIMRQIERELVLAALEVESYHQTDTSVRLGVTEANLRYTMKKHGIEPVRRKKSRERKKRARSRMARIG